MKVMVVDDEELIMEKIVYLLNDSAIEFESITGAGNGQEALHLIEAGNIPDIIVTDVRMPVMNGLELIESVRNSNPEIRFIVVSGYAEFEYAVKSMQFGVTNYLLKPVKANELIQIVDQLRAEIVSVHQEKEAKQQTESMKVENKRMAVEKMLYHLLNDHLNDSSLRARLEQESSILSYGAYIVSVVKLHPNQQQVKSDIYPELHKHFGGEPDRSWLMENYFGKDIFLVVFGGKAGEEIVETAARQTEMLHKLLREQYQLEATIGISNACKDLKTAYYNSLTALKNRFLFGTGSIFSYNTAVLHKERASQSFVFKVKLIEHSLENNNRMKASNILHQFAVEIFMEQIADYIGETSIDYLFNEYINIMIRYCLKNNVAFLDKIDPDILSGKVLEGLDDSRGLVELIRMTLDRIFSSANDGEFKFDQQRHPARQSSVVDHIIDYINRNIYEEITLQTISEKFSINPSYLSRIFKAATDQGFVKYVTGLKIAKALDLLENSSMEIAEIAHVLGFSDQQYFNRVFKKVTEMTPSEARSKCKKSPKNA